MTKTTHSPRYPAFCLGCGWKGSRTEKAALHPCPKCNARRVLLAGSDVPVPHDPILIAKTLDASPALMWRVFRALSNRRLIGPWSQIGTSYWERATMDGRRVAWIWSELGGFNWETREAKGSMGDLIQAMVAADAVLLEREIDDDLRLVAPTVR